MSDIIKLDEHRPHITTTSMDGKAHVIPISLFIELIEGKRGLEFLLENPELTKRILWDWLDSIGAFKHD